MYFYKNKDFFAKLSSNSLKILAAKIFKEHKVFWPVAGCFFINPSISFAQNPSPPPVALEEKISKELSLEDRYFSQKEPNLSWQDYAGLSIARNQEMATLKPVMGKTGGIQYRFGASVPSIVCAPLQVCDVALQVGEKVNSVNVGDTARWSVEPAMTGDAETGIQHLIIKPLDVGLETSLVVATTRRTYHMRLRSTRSQYMPFVSFSYPEDIQKKWEDIQKQQQKEAYENTIPATGERIESLSFAYAIKGKAPWKPIRVYDNGEKTIIQMPKSMKSKEAPIFVVLRKGEKRGKLDKVLVNYRLLGTRFIVDALFDQALLVSGIGRGQDRVLITRTSPRF